jgi:opacity protein-like surface antigen
VLALSWHAAATAQGVYSDGWYVGLSGGTTQVGIFWDDSYDDTYETGPGARGQSLRVGRQLGPHLAVEFGIQQAGDLVWTEPFTSVEGYPGIYNAHTTFEAKALETSGFVTLPFGRIFEGTFRWGLAYYDVRGERLLDDGFSAVSLSDSIGDQGFGVMGGLGLAVNPAPKWRVRLEWEFFDIDEDSVSAVGAESAHVEMVTIGLDYRLGGSER